MSKIVFYERYSKKAPSFGTSFKPLIITSLKEIGYDVVHISEYNDIKKITNSTIFSTMKPENYIEHVSNIDKSNFNIYWNLEPMSNKDNTARLFKRYNTVNRLMSDRKLYRIDKYLTFDKTQTNLYPNSDFLPIGFHPCLSENSGSEKQNKILFLGTLNEYRSAMLKSLQKYKINVVGPKSKDKKISLYQIGLDMENVPTHKHIHWHRIMMYIANNIMVLTPSNLEEYGFVNKKHYIHYTSLRDCLGHIEYYTKHNNECRNITKAAYEFVKNNYYMPTLLRQHLILGT